MSKKVLIVAGAALLIGLYLIYSNLTQDDDAEIRELIATMELQAEQRDWQGFIKNFSRNYSDNNGYSYMMILGIIKSTFEQASEIDVVVEDLDVSVYTDEARATMSVYSFARKGERIVHPFGKQGEPERPRLDLKKEGGNWKIIQVEGVRNIGL